MCVDMACGGQRCWTPGVGVLSSYEQSDVGNGN